MDHGTTLTVPPRGIPAEGPARRDGRAMSWRVVACALVLAGLSGCGAARVTGVEAVAAPPGSPPPSEILVEVVPYQLGADQMPAAFPATMRRTVVHKLIEAHVTAEPYVAGAEHPGAAVLHVSVLKADPGNALERTTLGFGFGKARLQLKTDLVLPGTRAGTASLGFDSAADSGQKPGLILPGAIALGTGRLVGLAVGGGLDVAANIRGGLGRPVDRSADAIVRQLRDYYQAQGWYWAAS